MTNREKGFRKELGQLLKKYKAEFCLDSESHGYYDNYFIAVDFDYLSGAENPNTVDFGSYIDKSIGDC